MSPRASLYELLRGWPSRLRRRLGLLLAVGGLLAVVFVVWPSLPRQTTPGEYVPLAPGRQFSAAEFRSAQTAWKQAGLTGARYAGGVITVPRHEVLRYQDVWAPAAGGSKSHWADVWQSAAARLSQFSGHRERADAREIARAQVVSRLLEELPDIASADVVWDELPASGWRSPPRARATVYLRAAEGCSITPDLVDAVRRAVCGSKANLDPADVAVMDQTRMVTYDGSAATPETERAIRLAALYRSRLETALQHFPGLEVMVQADPLPASSPTARGAPTSASGSPSAAEPPDPPLSAKVLVTVPESTIRRLAGLSDQAAVRDSPATAARSTRDLFRSVEQHIAQVIRTKAPLLLPSGLVLASPEHLHIETIPLPTPPAAPVQRETLAEAAVLSRWLFPLIAVVCGGGALWMLRPRRPALATGSPPAAIAAPPPSAGEVRSATVPLTVSGDAEPSWEHSTPAPSPASPSLSEAALASTGPAEGVAETEQLDGVLTEATPEELPGEPPAAPRMPSSPLIAERRPGGRTAVLHDVLARLQSPSERSASSPLHRRVRPPRESPMAVPPPLELRRSHPLEDVPPAGAAAPCDVPEIADIEQLAGAPSHLLRQVVDAVDVETWGQALFGRSRTVQAHLLAHFRPEDADYLTQWLSAARPVRLRDLDAAQERVLQAWRKLRQDLPLEPAEPAQTAIPGAAA